MKHMKKTLVIFILLTLLLTGCAREESAQIAATTLPVYTFTSMLCEETDITVTRLVTENVSCLHDYTVKVSQMRAVEGAEAVICSGAGLEDFLEDVLVDAEHVIDASKKVDLNCTDDHDHDGHHHEHDPHIWLSPENAKQMSKTICDALSSLYPQHKARFKENYIALAEKLDALQDYGEETLKNLTCRQLLTFHDGFAYFAESFDLQIVKAIEEESGSEASAKELIELIEIVNTHSLPAVFTEVNGSTAAAQTIAKETGTKIYTLDMAMAGDDYFDAMYRNINTVKEALG